MTGKKIKYLLYFYPIIFLLSFCTRTVTRTNYIPVHETKQIKTGMHTEYLTDVLKSNPAFSGRIAVLPFKNKTGTIDEGKIIAKSIENLLLSKIELSHNIIHMEKILKNHNNPELITTGEFDLQIIKTLKESYNIDYILTGTVLEADKQKMNVIVRLINTRNTMIEWVEQFEDKNMDKLIPQIGESLFPSTKKVVIGEKNVPLYKEQLILKGYKKVSYESKEKVIPEFYFGSSFVIFPDIHFKDGCHSEELDIISPGFKFGLHWDYGWIDNRLFIEFGPIISMSYSSIDDNDDNSASFFHIFFIFGQMLHFSNFYFLIDYGIGSGLYFSTNSCDSGPQPIQFMFSRIDLGVGYSINNFSIGPSVRFGFGLGFGRENYLIGMGINMEYAF